MTLNCFIFYYNNLKKTYYENNFKQKNLSEM